PALALALRKDPAPEVRREIAQLFRLMGTEAKDAISNLRDALKEDKDNDVRAAAAPALGRMGRDAKSAIPTLAAPLPDPQPPAPRLAAAGALPQSGADAREAVPALIDALKDEDRYTRSYAAVTLGKIGEDAQSAVVPLGELLQKDPLPEVRGTAADTLGIL